LILEASGDIAPSPYLIEAVTYASLNPFFKTEKFRLALREYYHSGLSPKKPIKPTPSREVKYIRLRREMNKVAQNSGNF
jgi:hypothetical protein